MHLEPVHLADAREEQDVVVRRGDEEVLDVVVVLHVHPHDADPAAALLAIGRDRESFDVAGAGDRDDHVLFRDHVLELERVLAHHDLGASLVGAAVGLLDLEQLLPNEGVDACWIAEDRPQLCDALLEVGVLGLDLLTGEPGQPREPEIEDRLGLDLGKCELGHQPRAGRIGVVRASDQSDHGVEVVERDQVALEDVRALFVLAQLELRPPRHHFPLEVEVVPHDLEQ